MYRLSELSFTESLAGSRVVMAAIVMSWLIATNHAHLVNTTPPPSPARTAPLVAPQCRRPVDRQRARGTDLAGHRHTVFVNSCNMWQRAVLVPVYDVRHMS